MARPVVHFEITGRDPDALRSFYARVFDWDFDTASPVAPEVSDEGRYGFIETGEEGGIPGGVGGGAEHEPRAIFYVSVDDVAAALADAVDAGGTAVMGPAANPNGRLVVAHFRDPEGNLVGLAGPR
ncbi:VOC family protein [Herbiconiux sp. L3-i23]|uniref:VOC family protein n=1 Tax=Herbiconiux sp. L3-i23 TaxID=2905871 RepID=UPI00205E1F1E|nr:VOC family protein [Herbiconiux sp. L3-i23]BDI21275.1 glyoxalase [Herbiconiux sp. L3-i23]